MQNRNTILVTGGHGQVAQSIRQIQDEHPSFHLVFCDKQSLDITQHTSIQSAIHQYQPAIIINTAAYTAVDRAESEHEQCFLVNETGAKSLAEVSQDHRIPLIHLSTDYVFNGKNHHGYLESDDTSPLNCYGESKLAGENAIRDCHDQHLILRLSGLFSEFGHNFLKTMLRLAENKKSLRVVNDQYTTPTYTQDVARTLFTIADHFTHYGTYHLASKPMTSWYTFAKYIIENSNFYLTPITAIQCEEYPTPAQRPMHAILNADKIFQHYGISTFNWQDGVIKSLHSLGMQK